MDPYGWKKYMNIKNLNMDQRYAKWKERNDKKRKKRKLEKLDDKCSSEPLSAEPPKKRQKRQSKIRSFFIKS